jgi:hypothetical protein
LVYRPIHLASVDFTDYPIKNIEPEISACLQEILPPSLANGTYSGKIEYAYRHWHLRVLITDGAVDARYRTLTLPAKVRIANQLQEVVPTIIGVYEGTIDETHHCILYLEESLAESPPWRTLDTWNSMTREQYSVLVKTLVTSTSALHALSSQTRAHTRIRPEAILFTGTHLLLLDWIPHPTHPPAYDPLYRYGGAVTLGEETCYDTFSVSTVLLQFGEKHLPPELRAVLRAAVEAPSTFDQFEAAVLYRLSVEPVRANLPIRRGSPDSFFVEFMSVAGLKALIQKMPGKCIVCTTCYAAFGPGMTRPVLEVLLPPIASQMEVVHTPRVTISTLYVYMDSEPRTSHTFTDVRLRLSVTTSYAEDRVRNMEARVQYTCTKSE